MLGGCDVVVDFTRPDTALDNARAALAAGRHVVIGTTGFDIEALRPAAAGVAGQRLRRAELRHRRGADDALRRRGVAPHGRRGDHRVPPPGQARRAVGHRGADGGADGAATCRSTPSGCPGIVADQDVILGDVAQTLTIRHVTTDRTSFMPGVLLAVRRVAELPDRLTVGLERLLWP